jgi:hypothetical protein
MSSANLCAEEKARRKALSGAAGVEDWAAVSVAIRKRMRELHISTAHLARETGLSETTIRYLGNPGSGHKASLVAIAAVLRWRYDHLINVLHGEPGKNDPADQNLQRLLRDEVDPVLEELASLKDIVRGMDEKVDTLISARRAAEDDGPES